MNNMLMLNWQGHRVKYAMVKLNTLNVDPEYQRDLSRRHVSELVRDWNALRFYPIVCNQRADNSMWVLEGQHRKEAAIIVLGGEEFVPAYVWMHLTLQEEADVWLGNKDNKSTTLIQEHHASLTSQTDPLSLEIDRLLRERGLEAKNSAINGVKGIGTLRRVVTSYGLGTLGRVLDIMLDAYGMYQRTWSAPVIEALAMVIHDYPTIDWKKVTFVLQEYGYKGGDKSVPPSAMTFASNAVSNMNNNGERGSQAHKVEKFLIVKYNKSKRTRQLELP